MFYGGELLPRLARHQVCAVLLRGVKGYRLTTRHGHPTHVLLGHIIKLATALVHHRPLCHVQCALHRRYRAVIEGHRQDQALIITSGVAHAVHVTGEQFYGDPIYSQVRHRRK